MPSSSLFLRSSATFVSVLSLFAASTKAYTSDKYELDTTYAGDTFFDGFDFYTDADSSHGFVTYVDEDTAKNTGLIKSGDDGSVIIGVDSTHTYNASQPYYSINGVGRPSVRITSTQKYNHGLFIADISHMPGGVCGTWPAFWTLGDGTWPYHGEIDILEGANDQTTELSSLHTAGECSIAGDSRTETGTLQATNCTYDVATGANGAGCGVSSTDSDSYGLGFNSNKGGVYAMQWTSDYIKIWFWPRGSIPADIEAGAPTPDAWGLPTSNFQGDCDIDSNFINHQIVLDVTFCGDWAGATWGNSCAASTGVSTCAAFVADTPSAFTDMYWDINSIKVYQLAPPASTTGTTSTPTTTPYYSDCGYSTASANSTTSGSCPVWTEGPAPPAYLTNLPSSIQSELPAWTGMPPPDWCSYTSWMKSYTSANTVYASCYAKATNTSSTYSFPTATGNHSTLTGSYTRPTGSYSTPIGSCSANTGSQSTPTGSYSGQTGNSTTTGTWSSGTVTGSNWGSDPTAVTYSGSWTSSFPLTTGWAHSSILAPPMGGDGKCGGTISAGGTAWSWGSATSADPASKTGTTWGSWSDPTSTSTWSSWSDPSSTSSTWGSWSDPTSTSTATWASWTAASTASSTSFSLYTQTSWTYDPASSSIYWSWAAGASATAPSTLTTSVDYNAAGWSASTVATGTSAWDPLNATTAGAQMATFTGAASSVSMNAIGYAVLALAGLVLVMM